MKKFDGFGDFDKKTLPKCNSNSTPAERVLYILSFIDIISEAQRSYWKGYINALRGYNLITQAEYWEILRVIYHERNIKAQT